MYKNHFISGLCTTDVDFPVQLWDQLAPQAQDTLNLMRQSRVDPTKSAYKVLEGPYDWNKYPLAPPGCKAIIHEAAESRASWASRGVDAWYLHPSKDHYRCNKFYVPETRAYRTSGLAEYYPQHCSNPNFSPAEHIKELKEEITATIKDAERTPSNKKLMRALKEKITNFLDGRV